MNKGDLMWCWNAGKFKAPFMGEFSHYDNGWTIDTAGRRWDYSKPYDKTYIAPKHRLLEVVLWDDDGRIIEPEG